MKYTNYSGGAIGADTEFEIEGEKYNVKTVAFSFNDHISYSKNKKNLNKLELIEGFEHVGKANLTLNRNVSNLSTYVKNLLSRNWFQVKNSEAIFAIGKLKLDNIVDGGTGWAVQMGIDNGKKVYVFDQNKCNWYKYDYELSKFEKINYIPPLTEKFAGIGSREINENGKKAIKDLFLANFT